MMQHKQILVTKRNGLKEPIDLDKIHKVIHWACENLSNVSVSDVEMKSKIQFYDNIKTETIHNTMIRAAADLISEDTPNYQYVAARLMLFNMRKLVLGQYEPIPVRKLVDMNIERKVYDPDIVSWYDDHEWTQFDHIVKHDRDLNVAYAGMKQLEGKYLVQDRQSHTLYETPQYANILIAATVFANYPQDTRMKYIKRLYDDLSKFNISLPTPIMAGVRTPQKQYSSCVLIECGDSIDSIIATTGAITKYISQKAGIGIGASRIRAENSSIGNGQAVHTGVTPFYKLFQAAIKSCSQGAIRNGSGTLYVPIWHLEIEDILVLRNNKGTEDNRVRRIDYGIQFNGIILERFLQKGKITLFSPHDVPDLHDAFYNDQQLFRELYLKYEKNPNIKKKKIDAQQLISSFTIERFETGRVYFMFVDHANTHSSFDEAVAPIHMSNLCVAGDTLVDAMIDKLQCCGVKMDELVHWINIGLTVHIKSKNLDTGKVEYKKVSTASCTNLQAKVIKIKLYEKELVLTPEHQIWTSNRGWIQAKNLQSNDKLDVISSNNQSIIEIKQCIDEIPVYDITVEDNCNFYANDILIHNCTEITLPTYPLEYLYDENGQISLCILAAINLGNIKDLTDIEEWADITVRTLDELIDHQKYPLPAAQITTQNRRSLGVGVINLAYFLAKNGVRYSDGTALQLINKTFEAVSYYLIKASMNLAKEKGPCKWFHETKYAQGILPIDTYKHDIDNLVGTELDYNWEELRLDILTYGMRNSTLMALMPSETSSQLSNATNGIEPIRSLVVTKGSKQSQAKQVVPEITRLKNKYELAWSMTSNEGYLQLVGVMGKYVDQAISTNMYYNPAHYVGGKVPMEILIQDFLKAYKYGIKCGYYSNTLDGRGDEEDNGQCESGACAI